MINDDGSLKTPLAVSLQKLGAAKAQDAVSALGRGLPCTVAAVIGPGVVTVNFAVAVTPAPLPNVTMAVSKFAYVQDPIKVGDIGVALSADLRTGGLTGLGAGVPNIQDTVGNLAAMTFFPLGKDGEVSIDPDALVLYENIVCTPTQLAFFGGGKVTKQSITGALSAVTDPAAKAVLTSIIAALTDYNLTTNGTS